MTLLSTLRSPIRGRQVLCANWVVDCEPGPLGFGCLTKGFTEPGAPAGPVRAPDGRVLVVCAPCARELAMQPVVTVTVVPRLALTRAPLALEATRTIPAPDYAQAEPIRRTA